MKARDINCVECGKIATIYWTKMSWGFCVPCEKIYVDRLVARSSRVCGEPFPEREWIEQRAFINQDVEIGRLVAANPENFA